MKSGFYKQPVMTSSVVGLRRSSKAPKAKLVPRTGHGHCLLVCCQSDPLQLSEFQWNHYIWQVCSANQLDAPKTAMPAATTSKQNGPGSSLWQRLITRRTISTSKAQRLGYNVLPYVPCSPDFLPTDYHFFKHLDFLQGKCFHNQQEAENAFQKFVKS